MGKGNFDIPEAIKKSKPFSKNLGLVTEPCLAIKKTVKILPSETATLDLVIVVGYQEEKVNKLLQNYSNSNTVQKTYELSRAKTEAETVYLGLKGADIEEYQKCWDF